MTPFGKKVRSLRAARSVTLKRMASDLQLSPAYLSSLEHGRRGRPSEALVVQVCEYFNLIWDDFEEVKRLAELSHPRAVVDTSGLSPAHTELANELAARIGELSSEDAEALLAQLTMPKSNAP
ncbi:MAG: helix-turn-helix domain-containing protein [Alphaproteobacteria bacterium]|nr:helix-turn-helix domain-containing protein [Alphaproteobacteria bacterium]